MRCLQKVLYEFPISSVQLLMPGWIKCLDDQDPWKTELFGCGTTGLPQFVHH